VIRLHVLDDWFYSANKLASKGGLNLLLIY